MAKEPLVYKGTDLNDVFTFMTKSLEILYVIEGVKRTARFIITKDEVQGIRDLCDKNKLAYERSDFGVMAEFEKDKQYTNKGISVRADSEEADRIIAYIAKTKEDALIAKKAEAANDHKTLGRALGYPKCCTEFFVENYARESKRHNDYVLAALNNSKAGRFRFYNNICIRSADIMLISHFPCCIECRESEAIGMVHLKVLKRYSGKAAERFRKALSKPCIYSENEGVHVLNNSRAEKGVVYYDGVLSSVDNEMHRALESGDRIKHDKVFSKNMMVREFGDAGLFVFY